MKRAAIIGGGGYTAGELIRILLEHPEVKIDHVVSDSQQGKSVFETHKDLLGDTSLKFTNTFDPSVDVVFLCKGHGQSKTFLEGNAIPDDTLLIDLSRDYRLADDSHNFVYGLPELQRDAIKVSNKIANPGCFSTAIQLGILPLASKNALKDEIHIHGITGSTGAGQSKLDTTHFSYRNNNVSVYKAFKHQHLTEVEQTLSWLQSSYDAHINFVPIRGDFTRGIFISMYTETDMSESELVELYKSYYADHPFTHVSDETISLKQVVNTNKAILHVEKHNGKAHVTSIIDNLLKGASGQAVQNMNLCFGLKEDAGLQLKPSVF